MKLEGRHLYWGYEDFWVLQNLEAMTDNSNMALP